MSGFADANVLFRSSGPALAMVSGWRQYRISADGALAAFTTDPSARISMAEAGNAVEFRTRPEQLFSVNTPVTITMRDLDMKSEHHSMEEQRHVQ